MPGFTGRKKYRIIRNNNHIYIVLEISIKKCFRKNNVLTIRQYMVLSQVQYVTTMSVEVHVRSRLGLSPDPEWDPVLVLFYHIHNDWPADNSGWDKTNERSGLIAMDINRCKNLVSPVKSKGKSPVKKSPVKNQSPGKKSPSKPHSRLAESSPMKNFLASSFRSHTNSFDNTAITTDNDKTHPFLEHCGVSENLELTYVENESDLFNELIKLVRQVDPDILVGYELEMSSWGYLRDRAAYLGINLIGQIGRIPSASPKRATPTSRDDYQYRHTSEFHVIGRIVLNLWRIFKHEVCIIIMIYTCTCTCTMYVYVYNYVYVSVYVHTCIHVCMYMCICLLAYYVHVGTCIYVQCKYMYVCMYMYICMYVQIFM